MDGTAQSGCACINQIAAMEHIMDFLKELFTKPLSFEEFSAAVTSKGIKLADLSSGEYVAKGKLTEATDKAKALTDKVAAYEKTIGELKAAAGFQSTPSAGRATKHYFDASRLQIISIYGITKICELTRRQVALPRPP